MSMVLMVCCPLAGNGTKIVVFYLYQKDEAAFFIASKRMKHVMFRGSFPTNKKYWGK